MVKRYYVTQLHYYYQPQPLKGLLSRFIVVVVFLSTALLLSAFVASHTSTAVTRMSICDTHYNFANSIYCKINFAPLQKN